MRICCVGDIHYHGRREDLESLAGHIERECSDADAIAIVGDLTSSGDLSLAREVLEVIRDATGVIPVLVVPGNHDI